MQPYGDSDDPIFEGSGGGSFQKEGNGGAGGGVIIISTEALRHSGIISSDGE